MYTDVAYKKIIVVLVISFVALIVAAVLATYFAKTPKNNDENKKFLEYVCQNLSYIKEINDYCKGSTTPEYSSEPAKPIARLPSTLIPSAYELNYNFYAEPNQEPDYFNCDETIYFTCQQPTDTIAIHMKELTIDNSSFILTLVNDSNPYSANQIRTTVTWTYEPDKEFMFIKFGQYSFTPNSSYSLRLVFSAPFRSDSTGLYKTFYTNQQLKSTRWLVILESQPISARRAFVCFDEPTYKAKYKISVIHSSQLVVLSNMPLLDITNGNITILRTRSEFAQSPVISSYQISLVLSDYKCSTQTSVIGPNNSTSISICAPPASITKVEYSLGLSKSLFEFLETNYRVKYSLQKCDFVSLPQETSSYGRSNWGLIKMKDEVLFNDVKTFSQVTLQKNLVQISKQISHQWLSGLTTPKWWDDYWFYESLNSFLAYIAINNVNPGLSIFEQMIIEQFKIMNEDAISPIVIDTQQINRPLEEYFDKMSILKGTSLIKMAAYIIGLDTFSSGVTKMLSSYSYSNANQADFWSNFNNITSMNGLNLSYIMHFWTNQQGHPILNIKRINTTHLSLTQSQFSINPSLAGSQKWLIPFTYAIVDNTTAKNNDLFNSSLSNLNTNIITISPDLNEMIIQSTKPLTNQSYIIANFDAFAFYRVNYDNQNWDTIIKQLTTLKNNIPARNRAQFINDLFAFSQANLIDPLKPLKLLSYLSSEDEYVAWQAAIKQITNLKDLIDSTPIYGLYRTYVLKLVSPIYTTLGWSENINDSSLTRLLRNSILEFACDFEMQDCVEKSMAIFKSWTLNSTLNSVPIAYQRFVYCIGIEYGTVDDWKYTYNQFTLEQDPILKDNLLHGLSCSREPWLIQTYLNYQIDPNFFVSNETLLDAIKYSSSTSYSYLLTWQFVKKNWNSIYSRLSKKPSAFDRFIQHLTRKFNSQDLLNDLSQFFQDKQQLRSKLQTTQNRILMNLKWLSNIYDPLTKWLTNQ